MDIQSIQSLLIALLSIFAILVITFTIDKLEWWGGVKKGLFIMWNIICAIFILLGTLVSLIFIVFTAMLFASGKD
ncbi:hypothetical protein QI037_10410 [Staphylococcus saprophyticus]|uniref:Uncharacterized protein n=1 Tax=Staphylococcus cohnii TaxID=29382 RepID=A0ABT6J2R8_9STAP|nr:MULTISPECIES: hypothetical protein [Staphylococcus]MDH5140525.1 hypothetical protein [Staphylococcus cohnii]MDH5159051.1 hypothetical protein [Staphylococcus cohnii]MDH5170109.1 hypothetical protein [Staphylococcus cohnii]MDW3800411.1 hypothetical protein [Staphylococcus saprophyticus]MDW3983228.1 hypothetical protein [Staphylococcus saprophyticus]